LLCPAHGTPGVAPGKAHYLAVRPSRSGPAPRSFRVSGDLIFVGSTILVAGIAAVSVLSLPPDQRTPHIVSHIVLRIILFGFIGLAGLVIGLVHLLRERETANAIGWPPGNPFHYEVAVANIAIGTLGVLTRWIEGEFWTAAIIGASIFLVGAGVVHVVERWRRGNRNPLNSGAIMYLDFLVPAVLICLFLIYRSSGSN
jgi:hypothetical protein